MYQCTIAKLLEKIWSMSHNLLVCVLASRPWQCQNEWRSHSHRLLCVNQKR